MCPCTETDAVTSPAPVPPKPTTTTTDIGHDEQLVLSSNELQRVRGEMKELQAAMDQLRSDCDRRMKQLQVELDAEKSSRLQLVSEVEQLKKIVTTKLRPF